MRRCENALEDGECLAIFIDDRNAVVKGDRRADLLQAKWAQWSQSIGMKENAKKTVIPEGRRKKARLESWVLTDGQGCQPERVGVRPLRASSFKQYHSSCITLVELRPAPLVPVPISSQERDDIDRRNRVRSRMPSIMPLIQE